MSLILDAANLLVDACNSVEGVQASTDPASAPSLPAALIGLPELAWSTYNNSDPTSATFSVWVVVQSDGYALINLEPVVLLVIEAIYTVTNAVVTGAVPTGVQLNGANNPAYLLTVEIGL